jgi:hypothetical protein
MSKRQQSEVLEQARRDLCNHWWQYARLSANEMLHGTPPPRLAIHGLVLRGDEYCVLQTDAAYSRLYGGSGQYTTGSTFAVGHPAFVLGALATQAMVNQSRRAAAARNAAVQWREHQPVSVLVTNQRLLCNTVARGWLSFWFGGVTELYPDLQSWSLMLAFDEGDPLRLEGSGDARAIAMDRSRCLRRTVAI